MAFINTLSISGNRDEILVDVEVPDGNFITQVLLWTEDTFKDISKALDLSSLLSGTDNREIFSITLEDIGITEFDGIYFVEFTSDEPENLSECSDCKDNVALGITTDFTKYHECILEKTLNVVLNPKDSLFSDSVCGVSYNKDLVNASILLEGVYTALKFGWYQEAIKLLSSLEFYCDTGCKSCQSFSDTILQNGLGFGTIDNSIVLL